MSEKQWHGGKFLICDSEWDYGHCSKDGWATFSLCAAHHWSVLKAYKPTPNVVPKPLFRPSFPSSKTPNSEARCGVTLRSRCSFWDVWFLLFFIGPEQKQLHSHRLKAAKMTCYQRQLPPPSVLGGPIMHKRKSPSELREWMSPPKWESWRLSYFPT